MRPKYRHPPQGTHNVTGSDERIHAHAKRTLEGNAALPEDDPEIDALFDALLKRDDVQITRLIPLLKERYKKRWNEISVALMKASGRWTGRKKQ